MKARETTIGSLLVALSALTFYMTKDFPPFRARGVTLPGPSFFPRFIAVMLFGCGLIELAQAYREGKAASNHEQQQDSTNAIQGFSSSPGTKTMAIGIISIVAYALLLEKLGFQIVTAAFLVIMMLCFQVRPVRAVVYSIIVVFIMVALFERLFQVPLPSGFFHL